MVGVNLGIGRILVIVGLVVGGIAVLANGFGSSTVAAGPTGGGGASNSPSTSVSPSASPSPQLPAPQPPANVTFAVFNGTSTAGLAAQAEQTLTSAGYVAGQQPANSPVAGISRTVLYYRGGANALQNQSDAQHMADKHFKGAKVTELGKELDSASPPLSKSVEIAIVLGQDYASKPGG
jgi:hypothetical protein